MKKHSFILMLALSAMLIVSGCKTDLAPTQLLQPVEVANEKFSKIAASLSEPLDIELGSMKTIDEINHFVNYDIAYKAEPRGSDHWQTPNEALALQTGDCEDKAILKMAMIRQKFPNTSTQLLLVWDKVKHDHHAVAVVQQSVALDSQFHFGLSLDGETFNTRYKPKFITPLGE